MDEPKTERADHHVLQRLWKAGLVAAVCIALWLVTWVLDRASLNLALFAYGWSYGSLVNAVPVMLVFLLLLALLNRAVAAFVLTLVLVVALYAANHLKLEYLAIPVSYSDIYLLANLHLSTLKLLAEFVNPGKVLAALLVAVAVVAGLVWVERRFFARRSISRLVIAAVALFGLASAGAGVSWVGDAYADAPLRVVPFSPLLTQVHAGLISSVLHTDAERRKSARAPVDTAAAEAFLAMPRETGQPLRAAAPATRPDIIVIQSESFFDPAILAGVSGTRDVLPNLHRALASGVGGTMLAPTFGGGTLRTEFEVLTSVPMAAYPSVEFPYLQIVQPVIPGFARVLRDQGYETVAIHANSPTFWNRGAAFKEIGFQRFISKPDFPADVQHDGTYISDRSMTDEIITTLSGATSPMLVFAISIETHGPYAQSRVRDPARRDAIPLPAGLHGEGAAAYRNYLYHIQNADAQLGRLWDYLEKRDRPFVLVFYGDHLAPLPRVYRQTGFDNGLAGPDQFVPWFIVGSGVGQETRHIRSWMLGSDILRAAGEPLPPYYQLVADAQAAMSDQGDAAQVDTIEDGMYALAQMHLRGTLDRFLGRLSRAATGDATHAQRH